MTSTQAKPEKLKAQEVLELTVEDTAWLYDLLDKPANPPTEAMIRAAERRRELFGK